VSTLRALRKLILGETWILPLGISLSVIAGDLLGGGALVAGVLLALGASVSRSARMR
jgi:hypothetical protein